MRWLGLFGLAACGDNLGVDPGAPFHARPIATLTPAPAMSIAALDPARIAVVRTTVNGDALCPDCVDLDPEQCPAICKRTRVSLSVYDREMFGSEIAVAHVFPKTFDHDVSGVEVVALGGSRVGVAWLDCDNSRCGALASKQSCTAHYRVVDVMSRELGPIATLYENRFGRLQIVANPKSQQILALTGMPHGAFGAGVHGAIFADSGGEAITPWTSMGGRDALNPAACALDDGFAIALDDRRPAERPPEPCAASCECAGSIDVDPVLGGLYLVSFDRTGKHRVDPLAIGLVDDGHLPDGHYHAREVLSVMQRGDDVVIAAGQAIDMEAELFIGRYGFSRYGGYDSPIPLWLGVLGTGDRAGWIGSQPGDTATVNTIVAGSVEGTELTLTEPLDSHVFEVAPLATPGGVSTTFLLRGLFSREGPNVTWKSFDIVEVTAR